MLDASYLELHLGILNNRAETLRGKMQAALMEKEMVGRSQNGGELPNVDKDKVEKDKEMLELKFKDAEKKYKKTVKELDDYADKVLELTQL